MTAPLATAPDARMTGRKKIGPAQPIGRETSELSSDAVNRLKNRIIGTSYTISINGLRQHPVEFGVDRERRP